MSNNENSKRLDWLAEQVLIMFENLGFDECYVSSKRERLAGEDRFNVLLWCNNLDYRCRSALAEKLNLNPRAFDITLDLIRNL